jgi:ATP-binding cassette subfamily B protein
MPPTELPPTKDRPLIPTLRRFLPYLWPADAPGLKLRIVVAMTFVVLSKVVQVYVAAYALRYAVDAMSGRNDWGVGDLPQFVMLMIFGYAAGRLSSVVFDNLRNVVFERVGQEATRALAATVFRHLHQLSLRFHLERRTGAVTKVVERGTKSIDTMLYFMLFNIAPTRKGSQWPSVVGLLASASVAHLKVKGTPISTSRPITSSTKAATTRWRRSARSGGQR